MDKKELVEKVKNLLKEILDQYGKEMVTSSAELYFAYQDIRRAYGRLSKPYI